MKRHDNDGGELKAFFFSFIRGRKGKGGSGIALSGMTTCLECECKCECEWARRGGLFWVCEYML